MRNFYIISKILLSRELTSPPHACYNEGNNKRLNIILNIMEETTMKLCFSTLGCVEKTLSESLSLARSLGMNAIEIRGVGGILPNE